MAAGEASSFTATDIHRVGHAGAAPGVSLHAHSPARMGAYEIAPGGTLRRRSISHAGELRPLSPQTRRSNTRGPPRVARG